MSPEALLNQLSKRERQVISLVFEGKTSKEVGKELFVSRRTVEFHLANVYEKLQVKSRFQAFRMLAPALSSR